jgi:hypothetical protein
MRKLRDGLPMFFVLLLLERLVVLCLFGSGFVLLRPVFLVGRGVGSRRKLVLQEHQGRAFGTLAAVNVVADFASSFDIAVLGGEFFLLKSILAARLDRIHNSISLPDHLL